MDKYDVNIIANGIVMLLNTTYLCGVSSSCVSKVDPYSAISCCIHDTCTDFSLCKI